MVGVGLRGLNQASCTGSECLRWRPHRASSWLCNVPLNSLSGNCTSTTGAAAVRPTTATTRARRCRTTRTTGRFRTRRRISGGSRRCDPAQCCVGLSCAAGAGEVCWRRAETVDTWGGPGFHDGTSATDLCAAARSPHRRHTAGSFFTAASQKPPRKQTNKPSKRMTS